MKEITRLIQKVLLGLILILSAGSLYAQQKNEVFIQLGHSSSVKSISFSPDGQYLISGGRDETMKLWDVATGQEIRTFSGHSGTIHSVAFSPNGQNLLSGSEDETMKLWDVDTGREIRTFAGHSGPIRSVAFSPDGQNVLSGSEDETIKIFRMSTGGVIHTFRGHSSYVYSVTFSPDGQNVLSGSGDDTIRLWDINTSRELRTFSGDGPAEYSAVLSVTFSPDGQYVLSGNNNRTMKLWNVNTGREVLRFHGHSRAVTSVAFSPDGRHLLSGSQDDTMKLWDINTGRELHTFHGHRVGEYINSVAFSPDGRHVASGSGDDTIKLWNAATGHEVQSFTGHSNSVDQVTYSPDGKSVISINDETMQLWEVSTGREIRTFTGHTDVVISVAFSPDGRYVLSGSADGTLKLWEVSTGREVRTFTGLTGKVWSVAFSPDGRYVLSGDNDKSLKLWDVATGRKLRTFPGLRYSATQVAFSPDGRHVIARSSAGMTIKLWNVATGRELHSFSGHSHFLQSISFSPDGKSVLSGSSDDTIKLWNANTGREIRTFSGHNNSVLSVAFSPNGQNILSGSADNTIKLWDIATGRELRTFSGHKSGVTKVAFSPDGRQVISSGRDRTIRIWDPKTGKEVAKRVGFSNNEWVIITPEGFYDASKNGADFLSVRIGNEVFSMDNFFDTYYRPDIVRAKLAGEDISPLIDSDIRNITTLPPSVRFITPEDNTTSNAQQLTLTTEITDRGGGIDEVRLFHNGKVISTDTRGLKIVSGGNTMNPEFEVNLLPGENTFRLVAFSEGDRIESNPATLTVNYEGAKSNTRLFTLVIGINEYKNPKYSLNYARSDASGFEERIIRGGESIFDEVVQATITDTDATKQNIFAALDKIKAAAGPEDMFVFYYAGHGVMSDPAAGSSEFYMAPYGVTQLYGNPALLQSHGIAASEIQEYSKNIMAQKQLFVLDACQSGGATEMLAMRGAAEEKAIAQLARSTGTFWLTASGSEQFATEFAELGHGVFTYAILEGLSGSADQGTGDGKITVQELSAFLNDRVPELTQIHKGQAQYPSSYGYGQDFPISIIQN